MRVPAFIFVKTTWVEHKLKRFTPPRDFPMAWLRVPLVRPDRRGEL